MRRLLSLALFALVSVWSMGCATIIGGSTESVKVNSEPPGQKVVIDGQTYKTPAIVNLARDTDHYATFPNGQRVTIAQKFNPWFLGNILLGGLIGMGVDLISGAVNGNLSPDDMMYRDGGVFVGAKRIGTTPGR